jgi:hypothetical protein
MKVLPMIHWARRRINIAGAGTTLERTLRIPKALFGNEFPLVLEAHAT